MQNIVRLVLTLSLVGGSFFSSALLQLPTAFALPEAEALKRLDPIPVFILTNEKSVPILASIPNPKDKAKQVRIVTFFLSQQDAQARLTALKTQNPDVGKSAKVMTISMRQAYNLKAQNKGKEDSLVFVFLSPKQHVDAAQAILSKNRQNFNDSNDIPLFFATGGANNGLLTLEQGKEKVIPFYFSKQDLQGMLDHLKQRDARLSSTMQVRVTTLSKIIDSLLKRNGVGIQQIKLVPDRNALSYALELRKKSTSQVALTLDSFQQIPKPEFQGKEFFQNRSLSLPLGSHSDSESIKNIENQSIARTENSRQSVTILSEDIYEIANEITVSIEGKNNNGSGVLIAKSSDSYFVLTSKHVMNRSDSYVITTSDKNRHSVNYKNVRLLPIVDLAIVEFTSSKNYRLARLSSLERPRQGESIYISGFTSGGLAIKLPTQLISEGKISGFQKNEPEGYELLYSNVTAPGMSGGPILNASGQVIGVHGRAEGNVASGGKVGINLGIPIKFFFEIAPQVGFDIKKLGLKAEK